MNGCMYAWSIEFCSQCRTGKMNAKLLKEEEYGRKVVMPSFAFPDR